VSAAIQDFQEFFWAELMISNLKRLGLASILILMSVAARAQDVPGIEICTAEKDMVRRTSCLQSNINFLQQLIGKQAANAQQKLDAANAQIETLKKAVTALQGDVAQLRVAVSQQKKDGVKPQEVVKEPMKK
jgi:hypothetical protein